MVRSLTAAAAVAGAALLCTSLSTMVTGAGTWRIANYTQSAMIGLSFSDAQTGYVAGGDNGIGADVVQTKDGGATWSVLTVHPTALLAGIAASPDGTAAVSGMMIGAGANQFLLNGAFTNSTNEPSNIWMQQCQDMQILGEHEGFASAAVMQYIGSIEQVNAVLISRDGGATFVMNLIGGNSTIYPVRYSSFPSTKVGFVTAGSWPMGARAKALKKRGKPLSSFLRLHASGKVQRIRIEPSASELDQDPVTGWYGAIFRSTDGFQTWQTVYTTDKVYFNQIDCPSELVCFALAENSAWGVGYRSTDGGETWDVILEEQGISFMTVDAVSETEVRFGGGVIAQSGFIGRIYHSIDQGKTFTNQTLDGVYINQLDFVSETSGFALGLTPSQSSILIYSE